MKGMYFIRLIYPQLYREHAEVRSLKELLKTVSPLFRLGI